MPKLVFSPAPHLKNKAATVADAMRDVIVALIPISLVSIYFFRFYAVFLIVVCMATAALTEVLFRAYLKKKPTLKDGSALLTGLLVALCFSPTTLWWTAALSTFIAVGVAKELMGGLGWNRFNPALFGRVAIIVLAPWLVYISGYFSHLAVDFGSIDAMSQATPLAMLQSGMQMPSLGSMFVAFPGGALSETSAL
ncbi:MAG: RnfABCDGE type electron transport complex subunit D, partial [Firmicutes bacterium]|nr:RnfABCDGE type electron transport complex subunit D [Bacillota bacterium]